MLAVVGGCGLLVVTLGLAATQLGTFLVVSDIPAAADAVLVTYSANSFAHPEVRRLALGEAALRIREGVADRVVLSQLQISDGGYATRVDYAMEYLLDRGVPAGAIELLGPVSSEYEGARAFRELLEGRSWRRVVAYAPALRSRRSMGVLKHALREMGVEVRLVALSDPELPLDRWWMSGRTAGLVLNEYVRLGYYTARGRL